MGSCCSRGSHQVIIDAVETLGLAVEPRSFSVQIWKPESSGDPYPEIALLESRGTKDIGLAFSGGGVRAAVLTIGWLQALNEIGILGKCRYISTISGSTWVAAPMSFVDTSLEKFLGRSIEPERLNLAVMNKLCGSSHLKIIEDANFMASMLSNAASAVPGAQLGLMKGGQGIDWWSKTVGSSFFTPVGLPSHLNSTLPAISKSKAMQVSKDTRGMVDKVCAAREDSPFLIVNGAILVGGSRGSVPLEFTPMYYGLPASTEDMDAVFVEPAGYCASNISREQLKQMSSTTTTSTTTTTTTALSASVSVNRVVAIHESSGISSSFLAQTNGDDMDANKYERANFPMIPCFSAGLQRCVDGGSADATGVLALLRRSCKNIIFGLANNMSVGADSASDVNIHCLGFVAALFGRMKLQDPQGQGQGKVDSVTPEQYNRQHCVFPSEQWDTLLTALRERLAAGQETIHRMTLPVLPNSLVGVRGGYTCNIVFVIHGECRAFVERLPLDTRKQLEQDKQTPTASDIIGQADDKLQSVGLAPADLATFPYVSVNSLKYAPSLVMLMSQQASWTLKQRAKELNELLLLT